MAPEPARSSVPYVFGLSCATALLRERSPLSHRPALMKPLLALLALLALAALSPAPINDSAHAPKPVPEQSQATLLKQMAYAGAYRPVGRVQNRTDAPTPLRDAPAHRDAGSVAAASANLASSDGASIVRATEHLKAREEAHGAPAWLLLALAIGGAVAVVYGLRTWADRNLPSLSR